MTNYYEALGVARNANPDEIKKAYRKLASQHHPDKGGDTGKFQEIEEAYRTLSDPQKRQAYDNPSPFGNRPGGGRQQAGPFPPGAGFDDIFSMFGVNINPQHRPMGAKISLWIGLEDVVKGGPRIIALHANGRSNNVEIDIPIGIEDGDTIRYPKLSPDGHDLTITYRVKPDAIWIREGQHLTIEKLVPLWDLILGGEMNFVDITGQTVVVVIPTQTSPGSKLRLRGRGIPPSSVPGRANNIPGDLYVKLQAQMPNKISDSLLNLIRTERDQ